MAGPINIDPSKPRHREPEFGTASEQDVPVFLGVMRVLREPAIAPAFSRLLTGDARQEDEIPLAHLFEEICTMAVHRLISEDLLFDAFAFDLYWDRLHEAVSAVRQKTEHDKFCENFEICAELARAYRRSRPSKLPAGVS
ncbi:MAG TPA: hypothetical protein VIA06_06635 [Candidatus Dormibacteraeota bacterium]|jgi:hypothetical protein|nr:hypothetical protein [Candidatus Dormibacteraeota bacterium]